MANEHNNIPENNGRKPRGFSSKKNIIFIILVAVLTFGIGSAVIVAGVSNTPENRLLRHMRAAERYMSEMNYERAVIEYLRVLEIDPMNVDAILGLADAYIGLGDMEKAFETLRDGLEGTGDDRIRKKLDELTKAEEPPASSESEEPEEPPVPSESEEPSNNKERKIVSKQKLTEYIETRAEKNGNIWNRDVDLYYEEVQVDEYDLNIERGAFEHNEGSVIGTVLYSLDGDDIEELLVFYIEDMSIYADVLYWDEERDSVEYAAQKLMMVNHTCLNECAEYIYLKENNGKIFLVGDSGDYESGRYYGDGYTFSLYGYDCENLSMNTVVNYRFTGSYWDDYPELPIEHINVAKKLGIKMERGLVSAAFEQDSDVKLLCVIQNKNINYRRQYYMPAGEAYGTKMFRCFVDKDYTWSEKTLGEYTEEMKLLDKVRSNANEYIENYVYLDMDSDDKKELIGVCVDEDDYYQIWYCSSDGSICELVYQNDLGMEFMDLCRIEISEQKDGKQVTVYLYSFLGRVKRSVYIKLKDKKIERDVVIQNS